MPKGYEGVGVTKRTQEGWGAKGTRGAQGAKGTWGGAGGAKGTRGFWGTLCLEGSLLLPEDVGGRAALQQPQVPPEPTALLQLRRLRVPLPHRHHDLRQHRCHPGSCVPPPTKPRGLCGALGVGGGGISDPPTAPKVLFRLLRTPRRHRPECPQRVPMALQIPGTPAPPPQSPHHPQGPHDVPTLSPSSLRPPDVPEVLEDPALSPRCPRCPWGPPMSPLCPPWP